MRYLLNVAYIFALLVALPWLLWTAIIQGKHRVGFGAKLLGRLPRPAGDQPLIWLHAVSVGEVTILVTLVPALRARWPRTRLLITSTTPTGFALAQRHFQDLPDCAVSYAPLDFSWAVANALRRLQPQALVLVELELWPNLVRLARRAGVEVAIVNGRLSTPSFRGYCCIRPIVKRVLADVRAIGVQNDRYRDRFQNLGSDPSRLVVTGSIKFDGAITDRDHPATQRLRDVIGLRPEHRVFLAGSTQSPEESLALATFAELAAKYPQLVLLIVPRHKERFAAVAQMLEGSGIGWLRRSELAGATLDDRHRVVLVDTIGELGAWWGTADIAFVGGSLGRRGGQNMIEPAAYGAAICYGPNTQNFRDITDMLCERQAAVVVANGQEMTQFVNGCLSDPASAAELGQRAQRLVLEQTGAVRRTLEVLEPVVGGSSEASGGAGEERTSARFKACG